MHNGSTKLKNETRQVLIIQNFDKVVNSSSSLGVNGECDRVKKREALELEEFSWLDLPTDVVELILLKLRYEDGMNLACVCKTWRDIVKMSLPSYPVGKNPLLIHVKSRGEGGEGAILHCYRPLLNKTFQLVFDFDLRGCEIISAKDGTLLIYNQDEKQMRMVDPLNGYLITFPKMTTNMSFNGAAIGLYDNCYVIFLIDTSLENQLTVHFYKKADWNSDLIDLGDESFDLSSNPVYCDGHFYCLGSKGDRLGVFSLLEHTWEIYYFELHKYDDIHCWCYYLVDWIDTVMAVLVGNDGSGIHLFLLDRKMMVWKKTYDLCGQCLFLGSTLSVVSLPTVKEFQNRVFLPHSHQDEPKTVTVADPLYLPSPNQIYFRSKPKSCISSKEKDHAATTLCCCNNSGEELPYLGSTQNEKYCTIWYQPFYEGLTDD